MLDYGVDLSGVERDRALPGLVAEGGELDALVSAAPGWSTPTPAAGWTIGHQLAHLAAADANVLTAIRTPDEFDADANDADRDAADGAAQPPADLLARWRAGRAEVVAALRDIPLDHAFPWYGSELTARLMVPLVGSDERTPHRSSDRTNTFHDRVGRLR